MKNKVFYIAGPDGSGKTTFLTDLESVLTKRGETTRHIWIRSPKFFSKPLMGICRLVGLTKYKNIDGVSYGKHEFYKSKIVSYIFPFLQLIDFKIKWFFERKMNKSGEVILFDRFNLDTLADLMVDTRRYDLHEKWVGKAFLKLSPEKEDIIIISADEKIIRSRKLDTLHDELLVDKIKVFETLAKDLELKLVLNNTSYQDSRKKIINFFINE